MDDAVMKVSREEMAANNVPLHVRDYCAHIVIPLNICRRANFYLPWTCNEERHSYEICMYKEYERRRKIKSEMQQQK
eukprot:gene7213-14711_t